MLADNAVAVDSFLAHGMKQENPVTDDQLSLVQRFLQLLLKGDVDQSTKLLAPDATYHIPGSHYPAGTFVGARAVAGHLQEFFEFTNHTVDLLKWEDWMVGANSIAAVVQMRFERAGAAWQLRVIYLVKLRPDNATITSVELFFANADVAERLLSDWEVWKRG
jgi:ketosteroid isomerase-like protein